MRTAVRRGLAAAVVGAGAAVALTAINNRRWSRSPDATGGDPFGLPAGTEISVTSFDGTELWGIVLDQAGPDAPLVVLPHCWTGDHRIWAAVARRLAPDHRVVLYDQRGHGRTPVGSSGLDLEVLGDDLAAVLAHVDARRAVVAGHSMGGMTIHSYLARHPVDALERVGHVVLVATAADVDKVGANATRAGQRLVGAALATRYVSGKLTGPSAVRGVFGRHPNLAQMRATADTFAATPAAVRAQLLGELGRLDLTAALPMFVLPADILVGSLDTLTPVARARRMHELWPGSTLEVLPGKGHMLPLEAPDEVAAVIAKAAAALPDPAPVETEPR